MGEREREREIGVRRIRGREMMFAPSVSRQTPVQDSRRLTRKLALALGSRKKTRP